MRAIAAVAAGLLFCGAAHAATVALLIDDLGHNMGSARRVLDLPPPVSVAILPDAPYARRVALAARRAGVDVLVHIPMEAEGDIRTPHALEVGMPAEAFGTDVHAALAKVPGAIGVNNHEGSALTARRIPMDHLMRLLGRVPGPMVFVDSRTTPDTVAEQAAIEAGLPATHRDVFLDNRLDRLAIERQVRRWVDLARTRGCALAIAHPHPQTLAVLDALLPHLQGVERVDLATYVRRCGHNVQPGPPWHVPVARSQRVATTRAPAAVPGPGPGSGSGSAARAAAASAASETLAGQ